MVGRGRLAQSGQDCPPPLQSATLEYYVDLLDLTWGPADPWFFGLNSYPEILTFKFLKVFFFII